MKRLLTYILSLSFCFGNLTAREMNRNFSEASLDKYRSNKRFHYDGPVKEKDYKEFTLKDGTIKREYTDGTVEEKRTDGTVIRTSRDGITIEKRPDGTIIKQKPEGDRIVQYPDGTITYEKKDGTIITRNPDGTYEEKRTDGEVIQLDEVPTLEKEISSPPPSITIGSTFIYILAFVAIGVILFLILKNIRKSSDSREEGIVPLEQEHEDLETIPFESEIDKYLREKDYRNAIRYYFLKSLKLLQDKNHIVWKKDKTNADYYYEISDTNIRNEFEVVGFIFDFAWYGNNPITDVQMEYVKTKFSAFDKMIRH